MNIYHISQTENRGYDTYSDAVVVAPDVEIARRINPSLSGDVFMTDADWQYRYSGWASSPENVSVTLVGVAAENEKLPRVVCASFHAG
jgi:hypothetical protein